MESINVKIKSERYEELLEAKATLDLLGAAYELSESNYELELILKSIFGERPKKKQSEDSKDE